MTLTRRPDGAYVEPPAPTECPNGHPLRYPNVGVGWLGCSCAAPESGHRTFTCYQCLIVTYVPAHTPGEVFTGRWK